MNVKVIGTSMPNHKTEKKEFDIFGGHAAGICYMKGTFDELRAEPIEKTTKRSVGCKKMGHHSVFDHLTISMYLEDVPRVVEVMLDNERWMTSSVKSGRYTVHSVAGIEKELYEKWLEIFKSQIKETYNKPGHEKFFTETRIEKLAMENARYFTSSFTLVSFMHTMTYRQFNYVYGFISDFIKTHEKTKNTFIKKTIPYFIELLKQFDQTGYVDTDLVGNQKGRVLSLFNPRKVQEYFGDVYVASYPVSYATFLHLNRHRTLKYSIDYIPEPKDLQFYTPELIVGTKYEAQWQKDMKRARDVFPQAMMVTATEIGNFDDFLLKVIERKCSVVLLETMHNTNNLLNRYVKGLEKTKHPRTEELKSYTRGSRCTFKSYKCEFPCGFKEGVNETRKI
ncbi:MAG: FAD-dependent thymidylate synthase [Firmicutes bacterium]|nr:FAD-dependent thymidylate synthase [Bacillota bacterium]